jgi:hypothetical protein
MFEYRWLESVLDKVAEIYVALEGPDRDRMASGIEAFDARLAADPFDVGESRAGGFRVAFPPLLEVVFHIDEATRQVRVTDVARYGK